MEVAALIESLTGCPPEDVARSCALDDLRAARLLLEEAIALQETGPRLHVVRASGTGTTVVGLVVLVLWLMHAASRFYAWSAVFDGAG